MNYLAHIFLSQKNSDSIVGNIMGDFTRGLNREILPKTIELGIKNHIAVDKFTDTHIKVLELRTLFSSEKRRFAGIILDVLFDHFLHLHWSKFTNLSKRDTINISYQSFQMKQKYMTDRMKKTTRYMIQNDWLGSYNDLSAIGYVLDRLAERVTFSNNFCGSLKEIEKNYFSLEKGFLVFFPELKEHIENLGIESKFN